MHSRVAFELGELHDDRVNLAGLRNCPVLVTGENCHQAHRLMGSCGYTGSAVQRDGFRPGASMGAYGEYLVA